VGAAFGLRRSAGFGAARPAAIFSQQDAALPEKKQWSSIRPASTCGRSNPGPQWSNWNLGANVTEDLRLVILADDKRFGPDRNSGLFSSAARINAARVTQEGIFLDPDVCVYPGPRIIKQAAPRRIPGGGLLLMTG
jgi:hypothetical protein